MSVLSLDIPSVLGFSCVFLYFTQHPKFLRFGFVEVNKKTEHKLENIRSLCKFKLQCVEFMSSSTTLAMDISCFKNSWWH